MAKAGRKRSLAKRTDAGRVSRAGIGPDRGTERTQAMQALYGPDGTDAIGRAYRAGLLGEGTEAKALLDTARRIANAYWRAYATGSYKCPLANSPTGGSHEPDHEQIRKREEWLRDSLAAIQRMGLRPQFDALVVDVHPDSGPPFVDAVIFAKRTGKQPDLMDSQRFALAVKALAHLTH